MWLLYVEVRTSTYKYYIRMHTHSVCANINVRAWMHDTFVYHCTRNAAATWNGTGTFLFFDHYCITKSNQWTFASRCHVVVSYCVGTLKQSNPRFPVGVCHDDGRAFCMPLSLVLSPFHTAVLYHILPMVCSEFCLTQICITELIHMQIPVPIQFVE